MAESKDHNVNFFRPPTPHARTNMVVMTISVIVWAVGVFGFQFLLSASLKRTPEASYEQFQKVWPKVKTGKNVSIGDRRVLAEVLLKVLGKNITLKDKHRSVLKNRLSVTVYDMLENNDKAKFHHLYQSEAVIFDLASKLNELVNLESEVALELKKQIEEQSEAVYKERLELAPVAAEAIGLSNEGEDRLMKDLLPFSLVGIKETELSAEERASHPELVKLYLLWDNKGQAELLGIEKKDLSNGRVGVGSDFSMLYLMDIKDPRKLKIGMKIEAMSPNGRDIIPEIMELYLVHNRSALTDTKFMGFPFHYWYTAQFLLIMFVLICLLYGLFIDKLNKKHNFKDD